MIYIYKINIDDENNPLLIDTWDNKFKMSSKKMNREEVINQYNNGYYFTSEKKSSKIQINKSELLKAINIDDENKYALIPRSYDKEKRQKDENAAVTDMQKWLEDQQNHLEDELKKLYPNL